MNKKLIVTSILAAFLSTSVCAQGADMKKPDAQSVISGKTEAKADKKGMLDRRIKRTEKKLEKLKEKQAKRAAKKDKRDKKDKDGTTAGTPADKKDMPEMIVTKKSN